MLNKYIEELVKTSSAREKLDAHLQKLATDARKEAELEHFLKHATVGELAKIAGVKLPEDICTGCGNQMEKLGSTLQCSCGLMKKASKEKAASVAVFTKTMNACGGDVDKALTRLESQGYTKLAFNPFTAAKTLGGKIMSSSVGQKATQLGQKAMASPMGQKATALGQKAMASKPAQFLTSTNTGAGLARAGLMGGAGALTGAATAGEGNRLKGALVGGALGSVAGAGAGTVGAMRNIGGGTVRGAINKGTAAMRSAGANPAAQRAAVKGLMTPEAVKAGLKWGVPTAGAAGLAGGAMIPSQKTAAAEEGVSPGFLASQRGMSRAMRAGGGVKSIFADPKLIKDRLRTGLTHGGIGAGIGAGVGGAGGLLASLITKGRIRPGMGAGYGAGGGALLGGLIGDVHGTSTADKRYLAEKGITPRWGGLKATFSPEAAKKYLGKTASVDTLLEVGEAAGRILAKTAEPTDINPEEVAEAIEAAKEREDVPGRSRMWGIGGSALGGLGGGALGYGAGRLLGGARTSPLALGLGALGAGAGGFLGHRIGSQEGAEEATADRLVSFLRGRRAYMTGANQGMQQGYLQGLTQGMPSEGGESEAGPQ